ncbi:MAG TPA: anthranilate phosphoribosyltransferase, partial [Microcoleaceae bacterium UBA10368]|nr:anthranilate phosphoribosyltransferase [Microcoleaceae cyanobacterium UBA10368]
MTNSPVLVTPELSTASTLTADSPLWPSLLQQLLDKQSLDRAT